MLLKTVDKNGAPVVEYSYTLGSAGERLKIKETGRTVAYEYDELYRLVKETVTDHSGTTVTEYTYDRNSNRLTKTVDGVLTEYTYNELNQIDSETGISYEYDLNGNLVKKTDKSTFVTDANASPEQLSLPPWTDSSVYHRYYVMKPIPETVSGTVAPWGDSPGGGIQYNLPHTIQWLIDNGYLKEVY